MDKVEQYTEELYGYGVGRRKEEATKTYRIPGLDGLRAIAMLLIVLGHLWQQDFWYGTCPLFPLPMPGEALSIFFVLCGFLAGYYSDVTLDAKSYYIKRARKLFPTYYAYIFLVLIVYSLLGKLHEVLNLQLLFYLIPAGIVPFCQSQGILPLVHLWFLTPIVIAYLAFPLVLNCKWGGAKNVNLHIRYSMCSIGRSQMDFISMRRQGDIRIQIFQCVSI